MTIKEYQRIKLVMVVALALVFSQAIFFENYLIPIAILLASSLLMLFLRRRVDEVVADERDYALGGKAALWAIQVYSWFAVITMFILYSLRDINPSYEAIGMTLAFSTCILMLTYTLIFRYYSRVKFSDRRLVYTALILVIFVAMFILSLRVFSGEDGWICQDGQWVQHGNPDFPAPGSECK